MRKRMALIVVALALSVVFWGASPASAYTEALDIYVVSTGGTINWTHTYDFSVAAPVIATLTIVADDVDGPGNGLDGEQDAVFFNGHLLGNLLDMGFYTNFNYEPGPGNPRQLTTTTVFNIDPAWLDFSMPARVEVESLWEVEIETSTLTIVSAPEPSSLLLLLSGLMGVWGLKRSRV